MTITFDREWCIAMSRREAGMDIGAGTLAIDPILHDEPVMAADNDGDDARLALGRFVSLMRRNQGLSIEGLADRAGVEIGDLLAIEKDPHHLPEVHTLYRLSLSFGVSQKKLMGLSGLTRARDVRYIGEAVRYAALSESISELNDEEAAALDGFIRLLSENGDN